MERLADILAVTWHDPPWKPWGIRAGRVYGCGGGPVYECIAAAIQRKASQPSSMIGPVDDRTLLNTLARRSPFEVVKSVAEELSISHCLGKEWQNNCPESHEIQAALIPATIAVMAEAAGDDVLKTLMSRTIGVILSIHKHKSNKVRRADILASSLDRHAILDIKEKLEGKQTGPIRDKEPVLVNPFDPRVRKLVQLKVNVDKIAEFILSYALWFMKIWRASAGSGKREFIVSSLAYLIMEPLWYKIMGVHAIPPADTRVPTHTVFDHINAALATYNWASKDDRPEGCLVLVDLKGIQSWISESRQLRDLWASSWLASLLAWKAVEPLVEKYGIGILVSPPARLHPFLAARLLNLIGKDKIGEENWRKLAHMLGLKYEYPLDPTVPATYTLALPTEACSGDLERQIGSSIYKTWNIILKYVGILVYEEVERGDLPPDRLLVGKDDIAKLFPIQESPKEPTLEPPLAFEVRIIRVSEAYDKVAERVKDKCNEVSAKTGLPCSDLEKLGAYLLYFQHALGELHGKSNYIVKVAGRRLGVTYAKYTRLAWEYAKDKGYEGGVPRCTVCGKAPAIIQGERSRRTREGGRSSLVLSYVRRDRLCPYCLVKRLMGTLAVLKPVSQELEMLSPPSDVEKRLRFYTIDLYTSRIRLKSEEIINLTEDLFHLAPQSSDLVVLAKSLPQLEELPKIGKRIQVAKAKAKYLALAVEASIDDDTARELVETVPPESKDSVEKMLNGIRGVRRKSSILRLDGDFMGKKVHRGILGLSARDYMGYVLNFEEKYENLKGKIIDVIAEILKSYGESMEMGDISVPVTPSYEFSLSRSLALQAVKVRDIVEEESGILIYTGGDDVLAVLPPVDEVDGRLVFPGVEAAFRVRLAYWGLDGGVGGEAGGQSISGFQVYKMGDYVHVSPATVAYGLSGSLLFFDVMVPFWSVLRLSAELEEAKDEFKVLVLGGGSDTPKDVLVLASDSAGAAPLPRRIPGEGKIVFLPEESSLRLLGEMRDLAMATGSGGRLSASVIGDYLVYSRYIRELVERGAYDIAVNLVVELLRRNLEEGSSSAGDRAAQIARQALALHAVPLLGGYMQGSGVVDERLLKVRVRVGGVAGDMLEASGFHTDRDNGEVEADLLSLVFLAARILKGTM